MTATVAIPWLTGRAVDNIQHHDKAGVRMLAAAGGRVARARVRLSRATRRALAETGADGEENPAATGGKRACAAGPRRPDSSRPAFARVFGQSMYAPRLQAFYNPFIAFLPNLGLAVILLVGGRQVIHGSLSLGDFTAFYSYVLMLINPMRQLGVSLSLAQRATASGARMFEVLDREPRIVAPADAPPLPAARGRVRLEHVSFPYRAAGGWSGTRRGIDLPVADGPP